MPMLFAKSKSEEEINLQLGSEISKDQSAIARMIPKIKKNKFNKSNARVLVAELSEKAGLKIFESRDDLFLVNFQLKNILYLSFLVNNSYRINEPVSFFLINLK